MSGMQKHITTQFTQFQPISFGLRNADAILSHSTLGTPICPSKKPSTLAPAGPSDPQC